MTTSAVLPTTRPPLYYQYGRRMLQDCCSLRTEICGWLHRTIATTLDEAQLSTSLCQFDYFRYISPQTFDAITIAAYVVFLGFLMCCVELNFGFFQEKIRRNFGCLFSFTGRTIFLLL